MNVQSIQQLTCEAVKKKFAGKRLLTSKSIPHYPQNVEREYSRVINAYMKLFSDTFSEYIPEISNLLRSVRVDAAKDEWRPPSIDEVFNEIITEFQKQQGLFGLAARIEKISNLSRKLTIAEWKRVVKRTLGIDIMEDYYKGTKFQRLFDNWIAENVGLIKSIPQETLGRMRQIIDDGYLSGTTNKVIAKQIQEAYGVSKSKARFLARDQTAKLNAQVTQEQQKDAGVDEYVWRTAGNISTFPNTGRVREGHARLNNKRFKYADPPVVDEKTGRRANPGEDYQCRCVALPVFDLDTVVLPWEKQTS